MMKKLSKKIILMALGCASVLLVGCANAVSANDDWDFSDDGTIHDSTWESGSGSGGSSDGTTGVRFDPDAMAFEKGASVRIANDDAGIRFHAYYGATAYGYATDDDSDTKAGMIIVPAQALVGATGAYFEYLYEQYGKTEADVATVFSSVQFTAEANGSYSAYGAIVGLKDENLAYEYQAVAYTYDGSKYTYSEPSDVRTISKVLNGALQDRRLSESMHTAVLETAISIQERSQDTHDDLTTDIDVKERDISAYEADGYALASVKLNGTAVNVQDGKWTDLTLETACNYAGEAQTLSLTYTNGKTLTVTPTVWSLLIKSPADLLAADGYTVHTETQSKGYFKLVNDIDMSQTDWTAAEMLGSGLAVSGYGKDKGFAGVFDGGGNTIYGFAPNYNAALIKSTCNGAIVRNLRFKDASIATGGNSAIVVQYVCGGTFENLDIELEYSIPGRTKGSTGAFCSKFGAGSNADKYLGIIALNNVAIKNLTKSYVWEAVDDFCSATTFCRSASALGYLAELGSYHSNIQFNNISLEGYGKNYLYLGDGAISAVENMNSDTVNVGISSFTSVFTPDAEPVTPVLPPVVLTDTVHGGTATKTASKIVDEGETEYVLVLTKSNTALENKARAIVEKYFAEATGITLALKRDYNLTWSENLKVISIGNTELATSAGVSYGYADPSGFRIKTVGQSIFLLGKDQGIVNSAYELLRYLFGFEYYAENCYTLDKNVADLFLYDFDITEVPDIEYRSDMILGLANRTSDTYYKGSLRLNDDIPITGGMHNSFACLPYATYGAENPHWYSNVKDASGAPYQLCYSYGSEYVGEIFSYLQTNYLENGATRITFQIQDNKHWCTCEKCLIAKERYGTNSGVYVIFLNMLARRVALWSFQNGLTTDVEIVGLAYYQTENAPTVYDAATDTYKAVDSLVEFESNLGMWYAPHTTEYMLSFDAEVNAKDVANLRSWGMLTDQLYMWTYNQAQFSQYFVFYDNFGSMQRNYQLMVQNGVVSLRDQGQWGQTNATAFNTLRLFLASKLAWNCQVDYDQLIDDWFAACYGPAAEEMRKIFDGMRDWYALRYKQGILSWYYKEWVSTDCYTESLNAEMLGYIDEAYAAIANLETTDPELYAAIKNRICLESLVFRYMEITNSSANYTADELLAMKNAFKADCVMLNVTQYGDHKSVEALWETWGI